MASVSFVFDRPYDLRVYSYCVGTMSAEFEGKVCEDASGPGDGLFTASRMQNQPGVSSG